MVPDQVIGHGGSSGGIFAASQMFVAPKAALARRADQRHRDQGHIDNDEQRGETHHCSLGSSSIDGALAQRRSSQKRSKKSQGKNLTH